MKILAGKKSQTFIKIKRKKTLGKAMQIKGKNKRGAAPVIPSGGEAGVVIGLITIALVLYIVFLPSSERAELLGETPTEGAGQPATEVLKILLQENVGRVEYHRAQGESHQLSGVSLFAETASQVLATINPLRVRNGWFEKQNQRINFGASDLEHTESVILTLDASVRKGALVVKLNDQPIYEFPAANVNIGPIILPKSLLRETNTIELSASGVGWKFWTTNEYAIEFGQVIAQVTDVSQQQSTTSFVLTETEKNNLQTASLVFYPYCNQQEIGVLEIILNGKRIYNAIPNCQSMNVQEIFETDLMTGKNDVIFRAGKGEYRIEQIKVETKLEAVQSYIQYFQIDTEADALLKQGKKVYAEIAFVDDGQSKRAELSINGHLTFIDQRNALYRQAITGFVTPGNNYVELRPETTLNINELRVVIR